MSDDIKELLKKNLEASERTLHLVEKMHRVVLWARFFSLLKWVLIISFTVWSYMAIQPYLNQFLGISQQVGDLQKMIPSGSNLDGIIKSFLNNK
ncbi:MAG: hypothetical protein Q8Q90_01225 [bacterium]|nr:hypothetical protein [bacterium]